MLISTFVLGVHVIGTVVLEPTLGIDTVVLPSIAKSGKILQKFRKFAFSGDSESRITTLFSLGVSGILLAL